MSDNSTKSGIRSTAALHAKAQFGVQAPKSPPDIDKQLYIKTQLAIAIEKAGYNSKTVNDLIAQATNDPEALQIIVAARHEYQELVRYILFEADRQSAVLTATYK